MPRRPLAVLAAVAALVAGVLLPSTGQGRSLAQVRSKIARTRARLEVKRGRAQVLTGEVSSITAQIRTLQSGISGLESRQAALQGDLDAKRARLLATQADLRTQRGRLARLRLRLAHSQRVLARRLVALYESDRPDLMGVVLSSKGFADLLETGQYVSRVGEQDKRIIDSVRADKAETTVLVGRLAHLEHEQRSLALAVLARRDEVATVRVGLTRRRNEFAVARGRRAAVLARVDSQAGELHHRLDDLEGEQAAIQRRITAANVTAAAPLAGAIRGGSGALIWPVNGPITSPFCERRAWEACHPGIDIGVGEGTPIRAAASGRVIIAGPVSGYGNYTCIQHAGPLSTCYGHQSRIGVSVGQAVTQGQVIGSSGCTGLCFGPHLHFETRINGSVVNPMNYL